jgi:hypothetical protein
MRCAGRVIAVLAASLLVGLGATGLISYVSSIGLTIWGNDQGSYFGLRWEDGWAVAYHFRVVPNPAPRTVHRGARLWLFLGGYSSEPREFETLAITNNSGETFSGKYSYPPGRQPSAEEFQKRTMAIHAVVPLAANATVFVVALRKPLTRWRGQRAGLCEFCGYDRRGNVGPLCPECGKAGLNLTSRRSS